MINKYFLLTIILSYAVSLSTFLCNTRPSGFPDRIPAIHHIEKTNDSKSSIGNLNFRFAKKLEVAKVRVHPTAC